MKLPHQVENFSLIIILTAMIVAAYCNTLYSPPVLDDFHSFIEEPRVYIRDISVSSLVSLSETRFGWKRWIPMITFSLNHKLCDSKVVSFHLTNLLIHLLAFYSTFFLVSQLIEREKERMTLPSRIIPKYFAFWAAGLWALNPVQTSAVTYLVQRMTSLQALFYVLSVALYVKGRRIHVREGSWKKSFSLYTACVFASMGAFLSKENSGMLPLMLILTEMWFFRPDLPSVVWSRIRKSHWGIKIAIILISLGCILFFIDMLPRLLGGYRIRHFTMEERLLTQARVVVWYVSILLWPLPSRLAFDHDINVSKSILDPPTTLLAILFLSLFLWSIFRYRKRFPLITYGCLWFLLNLVIESTIIPLELIFEHRLYLPSVGLILSFFTGLIYTSKLLLPKLSDQDFTSVTGCGLAIILSGLTLLTFARNEVWENAVVLYHDSAQKYPTAPRPHANLAVALFRAQLYDEAIEEAETAIGLGKGKKEEYAVAAQVIVGALAQKGDMEKAIQRGEDLLAKFSASTSDAKAIPLVCLNLAEAYRHSGRLREAFLTTLRALKYVQHMSGVDSLALYSYRQTIVSVMKGLAAQSNNEDLNGDEQPDPGGIPVETWVAREMLSRGERRVARELLEKILSDHPEEPESRRIMETMQREERLKKAQKSKSL